MPSDRSAPSPLRHVAVIMDGNGRWARERGLPRVAGHRAGVRSVRDVVEAAVEHGVPILTLYAFSRENWKRPKQEVQLLMSLLQIFLGKELPNLMRNGVRLRAIGDLDELPAPTLRKLREVIDKTRDNRKLTLNLALNYGSRQEILQAVRGVLAEARRKPELLDGRWLTEESFAERLYTAGLPDPDLIIRTSGEMRLSNFLLWQGSYSELYVTKKYWPDFRREDFLRALREYDRRERRFGGVEP